MLKTISLIFFCALFTFSCQQPLEESKVSQIIGRELVDESGKRTEIAGLGESGTTAFFLVRHAEKQEGDDPDLTDQGVERAIRLAAILKDVPLKTIFSTDTKRTRATVSPIAELLNLEIVNYSVENQKGLIESTIKYGAGDNYLIVGHSDNIPSLLNLFKGKEVYENIDGSVYDDLFLVIAKTGEGNRIIELKY